MTVKKNNAGMTLVEVVISCAVFSVAFLGVTMCFSAALKLNNRNMLRDRELNVQQKVIEEHTNTGVALVSGHSLGGDDIVFGSSGSWNKATGIGKQTGVTLYHAVKTSEHGNDYNFEIKGMSSNRNPLGNADGDFDKNAYKYCIHVVNNLSDKNVDVYITSHGGTMYEGSWNNGYKHSSSTYGRTLPGRDADGVEDETGAVAVPSELLLGYFNNGSMSDGDLEISWVDENGNTYSRSVSAGSFTSNGGIFLTIGSDGLHASSSTVSYTV